MNMMADSCTPSNPNPAPLPSLAGILDHFGRIGYRKPEPKPLPPIADILSLFDRLGHAAPGTEGGSL